MIFILCMYQFAALTISWELTSANTGNSIFASAASSADSMWVAELTMSKTRQSGELSLVHIGRQEGDRLQSILVEKWLESETMTKYPVIGITVTGSGVGIAYTKADLKTVLSFYSFAGKLLWTRGAEDLKVTSASVLAYSDRNQTFCLFGDQVGKPQLVCIDLSGNIVWAREFSLNHDQQNQQFIFHSAVEDVSGDFILVATIGTNGLTPVKHDVVYVARVNSQQGTVTSSSQFEGRNPDIAQFGDGFVLTIDRGKSMSSSYSVFSLSDTLQVNWKRDCEQGLGSVFNRLSVTATDAKNVYYMGRKGKSVVVCQLSSEGQPIGQTSIQSSTGSGIVSIEAFGNDLIAWFEDRSERAGEGGLRSKVVMLVSP
ncbi:hypothetical protein [Lacunimicrobium album]